MDPGILNFSSVSDLSRQCTELAMTRMVSFPSIVFLILIKLSVGFEIVKNFSSQESYHVGDTAELVCEADSSWEYCTWTHQTRVCKLEWKRAQVNTRVRSRYHDRSLKAVDVFMEITHNLPSPHKLMTLCIHTVPAAQVRTLTK